MGPPIDRGRPMTPTPHVQFSPGDFICLIFIDI
nr:MAG TPA: hypothetical protein [Caudoviricetes sp.]